MFFVPATLVGLISVLFVPSRSYTQFASLTEILNAEPKKPVAFVYRHIKQHLEDKIDVSTMSEKKRRFHYFSMNDLNKDNRIDGTEILKAVSHQHAGAVVTGGAVQSDETYATTVDEALREMDVNGDGYIDFSEYMGKQKN